MTQPWPGGTGFLKQSKERKTYPLPGTKECPIVQVNTGRNYYPTSFKFASLALLSKKPQKSTSWDLTFSPRSFREKAKSSRRKLAPTTLPINYPVPRILQIDAGDGGAAGAVALATSAKKNEKKGVRDENLEQLRITSSQLFTGPPSIARVIWSTRRKKLGVNRTERKRCRFFFCGAPKHRLDRLEDNFRGKPDRE